MVVARAFGFYVHFVPPNSLKRGDGGWQHLGSECAKPSAQVTISFGGCSIFVSHTHLAPRRAHARTYGAPDSRATPHSIQSALRVDCDDVNHFFPHLRSPPLAQSSADSVRPPIGEYGSAVKIQFVL